MTKKLNIFFISTADWDNPFWTNKQHMAKILSEQGHRVLYFESLGLRAPTRKSSSDKKRIYRRLLKFLKGLEEVNPNLSVFSPIVIPKHSIPFISKLNNLILKAYIAFFKLWYFDGQSVVFWTYNPLSIDFLRGEEVIYHCVDDLTAAPGLPTDMIREKEVQLVDYASLTFVTSRALEEKLSKISRQKVHYFPNVADINHFSTSLLSLDRPEDILNAEGPILGFIGAISAYKVDFDLIRYLSECFPKAKIVLIGQVGEGQPETTIDKISNLPNVFLLGPKAYEKTPSYLKYFDVALLPCTLNDYTKAMFPMKFFEYLAAEKKVVSTELDSLRDYSDCCYIAKSYEDFKNGVEYALKTNLQQFCNYNRLKESVKENTWEVRSEKMLKHVYEVVQGK